MPEPDPSLKWDFHCRARVRPDGYYDVEVTGTLTGEKRERTGYNPLWELIRLLNEKKEPTDA